MRICIPTRDKEGMGAKVHEHFGSAPYFAIYDTEKETIGFVDNTNAHHSHGTCHPIDVLGTESIDVVICRGMGVRAVGKLNAAGIRAYAGEMDMVGEVIKGYMAKELKEITVQNACGQHGCH